MVLAEDVGVGQEAHFGAALVGVASDAHGRDFNAVHLFQQGVLHDAARELEFVHLAFAAHHQPQPLAQGIDAGHAHAVQAAGDFVAVLVEFAARVQFGESDLRGAAARLVLVVHLHTGGNAPAVVCHAHGVVAVDGDEDVVAKTGQRLVDGVVHHFKHEVVQARAVAGVADVHAGAFAHGFQPFKNLDGAFAVAAAVCGRQGVGRGGVFFGHGNDPFRGAWAAARGARARAGCF